MSGRRLRGILYGSIAIGVQVVLTLVFWVVGLPWLGVLLSLSLVLWMLSTITLVQAAHEEHWEEENA